MKVTKIESIASPWRLCCIVAHAAGRRVGFAAAQGAGARHPAREGGPQAERTRAKGCRTARYSNRQVTSAVDKAERLRAYLRNRVRDAQTTYKVATCMSKQGAGRLEPPESRAPRGKHEDAFSYLKTLFYAKNALWSFSMGFFFFLGCF